jgi:hypothetical protein
MLGVGFGFTHLNGGYPGGQAEFVRVPMGNTGPLKIPDALTDAHRCCFVRSCPRATRRSSTLVGPGIAGTFLALTGSMVCRPLVRFEVPSVFHGGTTTLPPCICGGAIRAEPDQLTTRTIPPSSSSPKPPVPRAWTTIDVGFEAGFHGGNRDDQPEDGGLQWCSAAFQ